MKRLYILSQSLAMGSVTLASSLCLSACSPTVSQLARNEPDVCGGDFGMTEQMEYELRGNAKPAPQEVYDRC